MVIILNKNVSEFIKHIRRKYKLTQQDLAEELHVTFQAVSKWENKKSIPDIEVLQHISKKYNVDISQILDGEKKKKVKWYAFLLPALVFLFGFISFYLFSKPSFQFKTIITESDAFSIDGVVAYSKEKSSIYISNINIHYEDLFNYEVVKCTLYDQDLEISSCESKSKEVTSLSNLLKNISFYIQDSSINCDKLDEDHLYMKIEAIDEFDETLEYRIPLTLADYCQ